MTTKQERTLLAILAAIQFNHIVDFMILMPLGAQLMRIFKINPHQFGLLVSIYTLTAGLAGFLAAFFIDRFDRKHALLFYFFGFALGTIGCALSPNYYSLLIARALTGAFGGVLGSLTNTIVGDAIPHHRRGAALGIIMASFSVASVVGVPFSLHLAHKYDWHSPFYFLGVMSFVIWILALKLVPGMQSHLASGEHKTSPHKLLMDIITNSNQVLAIVFIFVLVLGQFMVVPFLAPSLVANAEMTEQQLPLMYLIGGGLTMFTSPLIGRAADKFGRRRIFFIFATLSWIPIYIITHLGPTPVKYVLPFTALLFICMGGRMIPAMATVTSTVLPAKRGSFMSIMNSFQQLAAALASYIAGIIVVKSEAGKLIHYEKVGYIAIFFSAAAILLIQKIKSVEAGRVSATLISEEMNPLEPSTNAPLIKD